MNQILNEKDSYRLDYGIESKRFHKNYNELIKIKNYKNTIIKSIDQYDFFE